MNESLLVFLLIVIASCYGWTYLVKTFVLLRRWDLEIVEEEEEELLRKNKILQNRVKELEL